MKAREIAEQLLPVIITETSWSFSPDFSNRPEYARRVLEHLPRFPVDDSEMVEGIRNCRVPAIIDDGLKGRAGFGVTHQTDGAAYLQIGFAAAVVEEMYKIFDEQTATQKV